MARIIFYILCGLAGLCLPVDAARIKDLSGVEGARGAQLAGYGLVVGLPGTGDKLDPSTQKAVSNMLSRFGITVSPRELRSRNVASVLVTADLPSFPNQGQRIDARVSSIGDASSLSGGTLLRTPLYGADGIASAVAQGALSGGRKSAGGLVPGGAEVSVSREPVFQKDGGTRLLLNRPDFRTAHEMEKAINARFGPGSARAADAGAVSLTAPAALKDNFVEFLAAVGSLEISQEAPAKVVVDSRTGTVVIGGGARLLPSAVSAGELQVEVAEAAAQSGDALETVQGETLDSMVKALNSLGASPSQMVDVLKAMHSAGVLTAELEVI